jgi:hypothetical protein
MGHANELFELSHAGPEERARLFLSLLSQLVRVTTKKCGGSNLLFVRTGEDRGMLPSPHPSRKDFSSVFSEVGQGTG